MSETLYRIEEFCTTGWELIGQYDVKLTKEQCQERLNYYIAEGHNPKHLRASVDNG